MTMTATYPAGGRRFAITILPAEPEPSAGDEANHRIANSLQLLSAMISIQAREVHDPAGLAALDVTRRRIAAIAGVHRQLYQAGHTGSVDLGAYLEQLGGDLWDASATATIGRRILVDADPVTVPAEDATAIGITVSELVTNALKYAYEEGEAGDVRINLRARPGGGYVLAVEDRGRGLATEVHGTGLGARLVHMMAARLGATCTYQDACPGTRIVLAVGAD